jgi:adenylylsulfate kinase-like enzyme
MLIYWFTGQPGAGKTTLANHLKDGLDNNPIHIDGDDLRDIFQNKDYSEIGRRRNIERAQDIARFLSKMNYTVIVSLVSPYKDQRDDFKNDNNVVEVYVHTTDERGRESFHVSNYEPPTENFIDIDTTNKNETDSYYELLKKLKL